MSKGIAQAGAKIVPVAKHFYMFNALGGTHAAESSAGTRYTGNLENSFMVAAQAVVSVHAATAWKVTRLSELANEKFQMGQITLQQKQAFDFQLAQIASEADLAKFMASLAKTPSL